MRRITLLEISLILATALVLAPSARGQEASKHQPLSEESSTKAAATSAANAQAMTKPAQVSAGTKVQAQLESAVDARTAKPGEEVTARVTKNVKEHGQVVIHKGDRLMGHITNVQSQASAKEGSQLGIAFDRLSSGGTTSALNTVVTSVISTRSEAPSQDDLFNAPTPMMGPATSGRASGGLLGSAGSAVGDTAGLAGSAAGSVESSAAAGAGAAGSTLGNAGGAIQSTTQNTVGSPSSVGLATPARAIRLSTDAQAQQQAGINSVFSTRRGDLRLDSGTEMEFKVVASGQAENSHK